METYTLDEILEQAEADALESASAKLTESQGHPNKGLGNLKKAALLDCAKRS